MKITKQQARSILFFMSVADDECGLCSRDLAFAVELSKFESTDPADAERWQFRHDEAKAEEACCDEE